MGAAWFGAGAVLIATPRLFTWMSDGLSFVSGTGGKSLYHLGTRERGSQIFTARAPGVLVMRLAPGSYSWKFRTVDGRVPDSGQRSCL